MSKVHLPCSSRDLHLSDCHEGSCSLGRKNITENGTYDASADGYDGYDKVTVSVSQVSEADNGKVVVGGVLVNQTSRTITENGTYDTTTNNRAIVDVVTEPNLQAKTTEVNGIVLPDPGYDGLSQVLVDVTYGFRSPHAFGEGVFYLAALALEETKTLWYLNPDTGQMYSETIPNDDNLLEWDSTVSHEGAEPTPQYTISLVASPSAGGSVSGGGQFWEGEQVTVRASSASGYTFNGWYRGNTMVSNSSTYSFTASQNVYLSARFSEIEPELVVGIHQGSGRISAGSTGSLTENLSYIPITGSPIVVVVRRGFEAVDFGTWTAGSAKSVEIDGVIVRYNGLQKFTLEVIEPQAGVTAINSITYSYYR